jgi:hypothetical protein
MPAFFSFHFSLIILISLSFVFIWKYRNKFFLEEKGLYIVFLLQGLSSTRHIPLWTIVTLPMLSIAINYFHQDLIKIKFGIARFNKVFFWTVVGYLVVLIIEVVFIIYGTFSISENKFYPKDAISFLKQEKPAGNVFSMYGWGGYLIWKYPEKKVYIDGRMPSWRWDANLEYESNYAMKDYEKVQTKEGFYQKEFEKYKVDTVLWPVSKKELGLYDRLEVRLEDVLNRWFGKQKSDYDFINQLEIDGWDKTYEDEVSVVYRKPDY